MDTEQGPECPPPDYHPGFHDDEEPDPGTTPEEYMRRRKRAAARSRKNQQIPKETDRCPRP
jgi:hypothetical protein